MVALRAMLTKLLLTAAVVLIGWLTVRKRWRPADEQAPPPPRALETIPQGAIWLAAYGLVALMLAGSAVYLFQDWRHGREIVRVEVVNPATGGSERYRVRRADVGERGFVTLEGRRVRIAETERMIVSEP